MIELRQRCKLLSSACEYVTSLEINVQNPDVKLREASEKPQMIYRLHVRVVGFVDAIISIITSKT